MINLDDLIPRVGKFTLKHTGKEYTLREISLEDKLWMISTFGDSLQSIFTELRMEPICRIAFRLMSLEDQRDFKKATCIFINEDTGEEQREDRGGYRLLLAMMTGGPNEQLDLVKALMRCVGVSEKVESEINANQVKKNLMKPTGQKSSISSRRNMAGRRAKS